MADVMALPPGMVMDPLFDWAPQGIAFPVWLMIIVVLMLIMIGTNFWWIYKFLVMRPVQGHGQASRAGNERVQQVMLFGMNRAFSIQALEYIEKVLQFFDKKRIAKWLQVSPYSVGMLGNKSIMLVMEIFDHPKDPIAEMAIVNMCEQYNAEDINCDIKNPADAIVNYKGYVAHREILQHRHPDGVEIPIYGEYDPAVIYKFTPENRTSGQFGGTCLKDSRDLNINLPQKSIWEKAMPVFLCLAFGIIAIALCYMFVTSKTPDLPSIPIPGVGTGGKP